MINLLKESLWKQFGASIDMLEKAVAIGPESLLANNKRFYYTTYHTLIFLDYYLTLPPKDFKTPLSFTIKEPEDIQPEALDDVVPDRFYTKQELLTYLQEIRQKCHQLITGLTEENLAERWIEEDTDGNMNYSQLEILLYNMRHVQHHTAQLNTILRQEVDDAADWIGRANKTRY